MQQKYNNRISQKYLELRQRALDYTNKDMNLQLNRDDQVYIAVFDVPIETNIVGAEIQTYVLVFGLNVHIYFSSGDALISLEKNKKVMMAMQSLLVSVHQVLDKMKMINKIDLYESTNIRAYFKTQKGIYHKELIGNCKEDRFILMLFNNLRKEIFK